MRAEASARLRGLATAVAIAAASWAVYAPALHGGWLWDDDTELTLNRALQSPGALWRIWLSPAGADYLPVKTSLQWVLWHLWGPRVEAYHVTSLALHALAAILLVRVLARLGVRRAWVGGLVFAVHPLAVESVAWISELKNVLSMVLLLLSFLMYLRRDALRNAEGGNLKPESKTAFRFQLSAFIFFLASMHSKSSVAMFPFVLLLHAWWKRGRVGRSDLVAAAPFATVSFFLGLVAMWFQAHRAIAGEAVVATGLASRAALAGLAVAFYLGKALVPIELMPIYPRWAVDPPSAGDFWPWLAGAAVLVTLWRLRREAWARHLLFATGVFVLNLLPVLGFVPMSFLRLSAVSDHFAYLSLLAVSGLAAAAAGALTPADGGQRAGVAGWIVVGAALAALGLEARSYAAKFEGPKALWSHNVALNPGAWAAWNNLGNAYFDEGRLADSAAAYRRAIDAHPDYPEAHNNLANILAGQRRYDEAREHYEAALRVKPDYSQAQNGMANLLANTGRTQEAVALFGELVRRRPDFAEAQNNLGNLLFELGRYPDAEEHLRLALGAKPGYAEAHNNLGNVMLRTGRLGGAVSEYREALRLSPGYPEAVNNLGNVAMMAGRLEEAVALLREAIRLRPEYAEAHYNLALALAAAGRRADGIEEARIVLRLRPDFAQARARLEEWSVPPSGGRPPGGSR
jgi:protein O-mannosyl-transferase